METNSCLFLLGAALLILSGLGDGAKREFPPDFQFGVATSSYQIEGAWNLSDKGENIWDHFTHTIPDVIEGNGDVACDSVRLYKTDVAMMKDLGVDFYRFSLSWSRILPTGYNNIVSQAGIGFYNNLINELIANGIQPMITLYHWDLPQPLENIGGWTNPLLVDYFEDYAKVAFEAFGDRVKVWLTFNEPFEVTSYISIQTPPDAPNQVNRYLGGHTILKAHARVYHLYDEYYRPTQKGRISLTVSGNWFEPADKSTANVQSADRMIQFRIGWFSHPIYSSTGDYPEVMKQYVSTRSKEQGFSRSRLPSFTPEEVEYIKGTYDFFGLNHYTSSMTREPANTPPTSSTPSFDDDHRVEMFSLKEWSTGKSPWLKVVPWGFTKLLNWIKDSYNNPEILIFENGYSDWGELDDQDRISYYRKYLNALLDAIDDGCNVTAYTAWSLMDNFEWFDGYGTRFGLYHVDFNDPDRKRTPKASVQFYKDVINSRTVN